MQRAVGLAAPARRANVIVDEGVRHRVLLTTARILAVSMRAWSTHLCVQRSVASKDGT
jgi:hypothetical protein